MKAINLCDGGKSCRAVAEEMGVGRTQIMNIIKRKSEILDNFKNNMPGSRKRQRRATGNEDINQLCWSRSIQSFKWLATIFFKET